MTAADLIQHLQKLPPDAFVFAFDADTGDFEPITGMTLEPAGTTGNSQPVVTLHTDDMEF